MAKKIGIDLHGVIDTHVDAFKCILEIAISQGNEVHIISGPPRDEIEAELAEYELALDVHYHGIQSVVDHLKEKGVKMWLDHNKTWWASDEDWWSAKAEICKELGVVEMIDDKERYSEYFKGTGISFFLYTLDNKLPLHRIV
jgi:hypothetical protein